MEKHELELATVTCKMFCNVLLHDCTRHIHDNIYICSQPNPLATAPKTHEKRATLALRLALVLIRIGRRATARELVHDQNTPAPQLT
jgi:hypothetical protein